MGSLERILADGCVICRTAASRRQGYLVRTAESELLIVAYGEDPAAAVLDSQPAYVCVICFDEVFGASPGPGIHTLALLPASACEADDG